MEIVVEFKHHMEVCSSEAVSPQYREPEMVDSPCRADSSTIVSCRHLVAHPVGMADPKPLCHTRMQRSEPFWTCCAAKCHAPEAFS